MTLQQFHIRADTKRQCDTGIPEIAAVFEKTKPSLFGSRQFLAASGRVKLRPSYGHAVPLRVGSPRTGYTLT